MLVRSLIAALALTASVLIGCRGGNEPSPTTATPTSTAPASLLGDLSTTTPAAGGAPQAFFGVLPSATTAVCPQPRDWPLLYWRGPETDIVQVTAACPDADRYWTRRGTEWVGYATGVPDFAVDRFRLAQGEAVFIRGKPS